jgi:hypothetical protein
MSTKIEKLTRLGESFMFLAIAGSVFLVLGWFSS